MSVVLVLVGLALIVAGMVWRLMKLPAVTSKETLAGATGPELAEGSGPSLAGNASTRDPKLAVGVDKGGVKLAPEAGPSEVALGRRRSERVLLKIPLEVAGTDVEGKFFKERTETLVISRHGAFFNLRNALRPGDQITVTNLQTKQSCPFRAVHFNQELVRGLREWGVECLDPASNFWGISFPKEGRRIATLPITIRHEDGREEFTKTENVSRSGVCCAANMELEVGERVFLTLEYDARLGEAETPARIRWRRKMSERGRTLYGMELERAASPQDKPSPD